VTLALPVARRVDVRRRLVGASVIDAVGTGLLLPLELLFLHSVVGLGLAAAGAVLSGAALLGLVLLPVAGPLVDRLGARQVVVGNGVVRAAALGACALPLPTAAVVALLAVTAVADRWAPPACSSLVAALSADPADRDRTLALMRAVRNGVMTGGALLAALVVLGGEAGFRWALALDALTFAVVAGVVRGLPDARATAEVGARSRYADVLRDRPFVALTLANAVYALGYTVLVTGVPAYVVGVLGAPASLGAVVFGVNTALVAIGQLPALRWSSGRSATRVTALGGGLFAASFVAYAALAMIEAPMSAICLGLALVTGLYTAGELLHSVGSTRLMHDAAPAEARGRYLAFFQLSWASAPVLGPVLFGWLVEHGAAALWLPLAGLTAVAAGGVARLRWVTPSTPMVGTTV
jgi:MFS family permease